MMERRIRISIGGLLTAAIVAAVSSFHATTVQAQLLPWNPPCGNVTVYNISGCTADLNLVAFTTGPIPTITVPQCPGSVVVGLPGGVTIAGVLSQAGTSVLLQTPVAGVPPALCPVGMPPLPTTIADRWVRGVTLGPAPGCCFDVYFYRTNDPVYQCVIFLARGTQPCIP
jgi:hypothetical protein